MGGKNSRKKVKNENSKSEARYLYSSEERVIERKKGRGKENWICGKRK